MARLADVPQLFKTVGAVGFTQRVWAQVIEDDLFSWAAALAYSWLFAVFPFLIFLLTFLPYLPEAAKGRAKEQVRISIYQAVPSDDAAELLWKNIDENLTNLLNRREIRLAPRVIGLALALWAASGGMASTMSALDRCYELERSRPFHQHRLLALGLTLAVAAMVLMIVSLLPVGTLVKHYVEGRYLARGNPVLVVFDVVRWTLALFFLVSVVALVYFKGPSVRHRFVWFSPGGVFCILVWVALGIAFRIYVVRYGRYNQTYGTVGGVAVLLLFFYIDALVLLIGAEINSEIDFEVLKIRRGTRDFRKAEDVSAGATPTGI